MKKRVFVAAIAAALALTLMPTAAQATGEGGPTAVVAVFTGNASVSPGLCLPVGGCDGPATAEYNLTIPGDAAPLPAVCAAAGLFEGTAVSGACTLVANGDLLPSVANPSCNNTQGFSDPGEQNNVTLGAFDRNHTHKWVASAGATIPITGNLDDADADTTAGTADHQIAALVQAHPVTATGTIACVNAPAETFIIVGLALVA